MFVLVNPKLGKIWNNTLTINKMIKVLFKSEELLIAADSESKVVYGNTRRNSAVKYLHELTPESSEKAMSVMMLIILILSSKYVVAKQIKVTTKTEVVIKTAKSSVVKTAEEEVQRELNNGATPLEALREWDII